MVGRPWVRRLSYPPGSMAPARCTSAISDFAKSCCHLKARLPNFLSALNARNFTAAGMACANGNWHVSSCDRAAAPLTAVSWILQDFSRFTRIESDATRLGFNVMRSDPSSFPKLCNPVLPSPLDHRLRGLNRPDSKPLPSNWRNFLKPMRLFQVVRSFARAVRRRSYVGNFKITQRTGPPSCRLTAIQFRWHQRNSPKQFGW